jgi:ribosomal protein L22
MADEPKKPTRAKKDDDATETKAASKKAPEAATAEPKAPAKETEELKRKAKPKAAKAESAAAEATEAKAEVTAEPKAESKPKAKKAPAAKAKAEKPAAEETKAASKPAARKRGADKAAAETAAKPARRNGRSAEPAVLVRAQAKYVRSSARKARLVCDAIRGKDVPQARAILQFHPRQVAEAWTKLLDSAVANAENNHDLEGDELRVYAVYADEGPTIKRFRPRAMGRATRIRKRTSHLTIQLTPKETR